MRTASWSSLRKGTVAASRFPPKWPSVRVERIASRATRWASHSRAPTYQGHFLGADIAMQAPFPRDEGNLVCGQDGMLLLAPLPGGRWISFQDLEEDVESVTDEDVAARIEVRLGGGCRPPHAGWFAPVPVRPPVPRP